MRYDHLSDSFQPDAAITTGRFAAEADIRAQEMGAQSWSLKVSAQRGSPIGSAN